MTTAKDKVLTTPELREAILLKLDDIQTLLLGQRVNKTFEVAIDSSIHLQQALWFKSAPRDPSQPEYICRRNPLIGKFRRRLGAMSLTDGGGQICKTTEEGGEFKISVPQGAKLVRIKYISIDVIKRQGGSWRDMLPCEPALNNETWLVHVPFIIEEDGIDNIDQWLVKYMRNIQGVAGEHSYCVSLGERCDPPTMGEIVDAANSMALTVKERRIRLSAEGEASQLHEEDLQGIESWWMSEAEERLGSAKVHSHNLSANEYWFGPQEDTT